MVCEVVLQFPSEGSPAKLIPRTVVIAGTNGEAVTLSASEKKQLVRSLREIAVQSGRADMPITVGTSGQSTRDVIAETRLAAEAGADFVLVLVPSYFHFAMDENAIVSFFQEVRGPHQGNAIRAHF